MLKNIKISKYSRIESFLFKLKEEIKTKNLDKNDLAQINKLESIINFKISQIKKTYIISTILYFGLYFTFFSYFFSDVIFLSEISVLIKKIISFFGTTFLLIFIFLINKLSQLYYQDLNLYVMQILIIYNKNIKNKNKIFKDYKKSLI